MNWIEYDWFTGKDLFYFFEYISVHTLISEIILTSILNDMKVYRLSSLRKYSTHMFDEHYHVCQPIDLYISINIALEPSQINPHNLKTKSKIQNYHSHLLHTVSYLLTSYHFWKVDDVRYPYVTPPICWLLSVIIII